MHNGALKKWALALTFWLALHMSSLKAQIFTAPLQASTTGTNPVDFEFRADGTLIAKGNYGVGSLLSTDQGVGTRMLWFPTKAAFRAGGLDSAGIHDWDLANIGQYSVAFGFNATASGYGSISLGDGTKASGIGSMAFGSGATASADFSIAFGGATAATQTGATAFGGSTTASGIYSTAFGGMTTASGYYSTAFGKQTVANGSYSTASGFQTTASAYLSFVFGKCNVGGGNPTTWVATDPLFEVGSGSDGSHLHDALLLDKSGNLTVKTVTTTAPAGDIPMYTGN